MKNPTLRTDGFYYSGPVEWEDWHAGVHMRETHYHFWRFCPNGIWLCCHRYEHDFDFWTFTNALTPAIIEKGRHDGAPLMKDGLQLFIAGTYVVAGEILTTYWEWRMPLSPSGVQVFKSETRWTIRDEALRRRDEEDRAEIRFTRPRRSND